MRQYVQFSWSEIDEVVVRLGQLWYTVLSLVFPRLAKTRLCVGGKCDPVLTEEQPRH
jgi:hypothetical protein